MIELLDRILGPRGLSMALQPIFEMLPEGRRVHSMECLARGPRGTSAESAEVLFSYIRLKHQEIRVDRLCVDSALEAITGLPSDLSLSINVHTSTLCRDEGFVDFLSGLAAQKGIDPSRLTVEVVEHQPVRETRRLIDALDRLRGLGIRIALDDIGNGHSNFRRLLDCNPHFFKIDRHVIQGCHRDRRRSAVIESIVLLAHNFGAQVIAEGIEDAADLEAVSDLGIFLVQGYALARPLPAHQAARFLIAEREMEGSWGPLCESRRLPEEDPPERGEDP
jgi:EAL domain-containing protein (putative c-di-GMP-specific phosphodiesterase class I)